MAPPIRSTDPRRSPVRILWGKGVNAIENTLRKNQINFCHGAVESSWSRPEALTYPREAAPPLRDTSRQTLRSPLTHAAACLCALADRRTLTTHFL